MRSSVLSRLAALLNERRSGRRVDWIRIAFLLAVALLVALGVVMSLTASAQESQAAAPTSDR
jgi:hypothetical protein